MFLLKNSCINLFKSFERQRSENCARYGGDNGPMEAFWGMLKSEMYYLRKFDSYEELEYAVSGYIDFYNNGRYQKRLDCMTPLEYRQYLSNIAA